MEFKDRLISLRKKTKLYQVDMAKKIGVARATYGAYEQGTRQPDFETLQSIADFFEVSTDYLLGRTDEPQAQKTAIVVGQEINLSNEELQLFNELKKHPIMFHDLASDPEKKVKELIKLYKMKKFLMEDNDENDEDGFGDLED